jgi:hypothetical protein
MMKRYEAIYNGYRIILRAKSLEVATEIAKKEFMKSMRMTRWQEMYFSIKEVAK